MADRTSAGIFAEVFEFLAKEPEKNKEAALHFWEKQRDYDFSPEQMCCDEALTKLGLCRRGIHPDWPDDGEVDLYGPNGDE